MRSDQLTMQSIAALALLTLACGAHALPTQLAGAPMSSASSVAISTNILFVLDDSESMKLGFLPDWAGSTPERPHGLDRTRNAAFNGIAYDPTISYSPPKFFDIDGAADTTTYPSQTGPITNNWTAVKVDGYGVQSEDTIDLVNYFYAYYFTTVAGEYCTKASLKSCSDTASETYAHAAKLRWCKTAAAAVALSPAAGACQATQIEPAGSDTGFTYPRMPAPRTSTLTIGGTGATSISSITVGAQEILSAAVTAQGTPLTLADEINASINACSFKLTGSCQVAGYRATVSNTGDSVTISAPGITALLPVIAKVGPMSVTATAFGRPASNPVPGENLLTVILPGATYPKTAKRSDCQGDSCTYAEEMTNYANWYAYYSTRMQAMKTATSLSFEPTDERQRIGYMTINNNNSGNTDAADSDFQNIAAFDAAQKHAWYKKLFAAVPNLETPLRVALSNAGRLYAGRLNGSSINGVAVVDPVQYYCQNNVTILSTDGYWNEGAGFKLDGATPVGDQDGPGLEVRPMLDGGAPLTQRITSQTTETRTPTLATQKQMRTEQFKALTADVKTQTLTQPIQRTSRLQQHRAIVFEQKAYLQMDVQQLLSSIKVRRQRTSQQEIKSGPGKKRTKDVEIQTKTVLQERTAQLMKHTAKWQRSTYNLQQQLTQVQQSTSNNGGTSFGAWSNVASCTPVSSGPNQVQCRTLAQSGWSAVDTCRTIQGGETINNAGKDSQTTTYTTDSKCAYSAPQVTENLDSCTAKPKSSGPDYDGATAVLCLPSWPGDPTPADSCTGSDSVRCSYSAWTVWTSLPAGAVCQEATQASGAKIARECQPTWTAWAKITTPSPSCTPSETVGCQYSGSWNAWTDTNDVCTEVGAQTGSNPYTPQVDCKIDGSWASATDWCTAVTSGPLQTECRYTSWSSWEIVGSCTKVDRWTPGATTAIDCQDYWTDYTDLGPCVANATTRCKTGSTGVVRTDSCPPNTTCTYSAWGQWVRTDDLRCEDSPRNQGLAEIKQCSISFVYTTPANATESCEVLPGQRCSYTAWSQWNPVASCENATPQSPETAKTKDVLEAVECGMDWKTILPPPDSCEPIDGAVKCDTTWPTTWADVGKDDCRESDTQRCDKALVMDWTDVGDCKQGVTDGGLETLCTTRIPDPRKAFVMPGDCQEQEASDENGGLLISCDTNTKIEDNVADCRAQAPAATNDHIEISCPVEYLGATPDTLADVAEYYWKNDLRAFELTDDVSAADVPTVPAYCTGGPIVVSGTTIHNDVCTNDDLHPRQYMSTYTLGLGASGLMQYDKKYQTQTEGDFYSIKTGQTADTNAGVCPWQNNGECNWPKPENNEQTNIDDLWHAAVNGRGTYFSASDPASLAAGISDALSQVEVKAGALAAVSVVSPNLVADENGVFEVSFKVGEWSGDVIKRTVDGDTGALSPLPVPPTSHTLPGWSAQESLDKKAHTARTIYTFNPTGESASGAADRLKTFFWANLSPTEQGYFAAAALTGKLSQFCETGTICLGASTQTAASGEPVVNFVRGDRTNEGPINDLTKYYRQRAHLLGDIVGSEAVYVQSSPWNYADAQYGAFKTANHSRKEMLYIGANDGMLHAFDAATGEEEWAYIPTMVIPKLAKLADKNYHVQGAHQFTVDGTPVMGDICVSDCGTSSAVWKTILVGGLNNGGRGYYALDITSPTAPKALWEFTNDNLGYSYGNPVITKLKDGTWVVIVASGYNNISPGDGDGHLFVLNASSGTLIRTISTGVGDTTTPSGLSRISAWANFPDNNNTAQRIYGGDQFGNLWRFDVNGDIPLIADPRVYDAQRLATLKNADGLAQPITTKPELGKVGGHPVVFVATGQLLGPDDLGTRQQHSMYAIKDRLTDSDYGSPRPLTLPQTTPVPGTFVAQTLTTGSCPEGNAFCTSGNAIVTGSNNAVDFNTHDGWYVDFPELGERVNTEMRLQLGTLAFNTNTPTIGACKPVGVSFAYYLDYRSGGAVEGTDGIAGVRLGDYLSASPSIIRLVDGTIRALVRTDAPSTISTPVPTAPTPFDTRRVSWRELITE
ncbi:PilC/PilY family type IV pilus protein [Accumulibacter sp.]|uniref:pilus assembly protein n=1 Tax=Accumulibacter sp. TaxID=2053492 RepID=UPI002C2272E4|nr:PilC/PilY family type IV pilus protein [Accumulibacter sp.]HRF04431.1 PilC/PilY family type IV pilus protein [Accumulibacter sp.]